MNDFELIQRGFTVKDPTRDHIVNMNPYIGHEFKKLRVVRYYILSILRFFTAFTFMMTTNATWVYYAYKYELEPFIGFIIGLFSILVYLLIIDIFENIITLKKYK